jgi:hypothetical protein
MQNASPVAARPPASAPADRPRIIIQEKPPMSVNPIQMQKFLKGVDYPARKEELLANAEELGADDEVRATLDRLPDQEYETPADVSKALGNLD